MKCWSQSPSSHSPSPPTLPTVGGDGGRWGVGGGGGSLSRAMCGGPPHTGGRSRGPSSSVRGQPARRAAAVEEQGARRAGCGDSALHPRCPPRRPSSRRWAAHGVLARLPRPQPTLCCCSGTALARQPTYGDSASRPLGEVQRPGLHSLRRLCHLLLLLKLQPLRRRCPHLAALAGAGHQGRAH